MINLHIKIAAKSVSNPISLGTVPVKVLLSKKWKSNSNIKKLRKLKQIEPIIIESLHKCLNIEIVFSIYNLHRTKSSKLFINPISLGILPVKALLPVKW